jgi:hypothetical protein
MEAELHASGRTDRQTDMTNLIVAFHYFEKAPKSDFIEKQLVRCWCLIKAFIFGRLISVFSNYNYSGRTSQRTPQALLEINSILYVPCGEATFISRLLFRYTSRF